MRRRRSAATRCRPSSNRLRRPQEFKTVEELLLAGQRADQFHSPTLEPDPFWQEALRRDPGDARVNTAYGIVKLKRMQFAEAERHFRAAIARLEFPHTTPKDAEPYYYLGLALKAQGRRDEAYDAFFKATWNGEWKAPAYFELAQIASGRGDFAAARDHVERSLAHNAFNQRAQNLLLAIAGTRRLRRCRRSRTVPGDGSDGRDDTRGARAGWRRGRGPRRSRPLLRDHPRAGLETAVDYIDAGLRGDAASVLDRLVAAGGGHAARRSPGALLPCLRRRPGGRSAHGLPTAAGLPRRSRWTTRSPSRRRRFPSSSARWRRTRGTRARRTSSATCSSTRSLIAAVALWERAVELQPDFTVALRNLALAYAAPRDQGRVQRAVAMLERAVATGGSTPVHYFELDQLYESSGTPVANAAGDDGIAQERDPGARRLDGELRRPADVLRDAPTPQSRCCAAASSTSGKAARASTPATPGPTPTSRAGGSSWPPAATGRPWPTSRPRWISPRTCAPNAARARADARRRWPTGPASRSRRLGRTAGGPRRLAGGGRRRDSRSPGGAAPTPPWNAPFSRYYQAVALRRLGDTATRADDRVCARCSRAAARRSPKRQRTSTTSRPSASGVRSAAVVADAHFVVGLGQARPGGDGRRAGGLPRRRSRRAPTTSAPRWRSARGRRSAAVPAEC